MQLTTIVAEALEVRPEIGRPDAMEKYEPGTNGVVCDADKVPWPLLVTMMVLFCAPEAAVNGPNDIVDPTAGVEAYAGPMAMLVSAYDGGVTRYARSLVRTVSTLDCMPEKFGGENCTTTFVCAMDDRLAGKPDTTEKYVEFANESKSTVR
jgi:hypothetical protein